VGDQAFGTPEHTAGASFSAALASSTTITGGLAYVGSWNDYDYVAQFSCFGGTGPCYDFNFRSFIITYPGFVKLNAGVVQEIRHSISAFLAVDNLTNSDAFEQSNAYPVMGRVTTAGLRFQL
jgi:outer membrane receptor protein involved in Fe transport